MSSPPPSPPPPVSSLRSRFEQLAAGSASHNHKPRASIAHELGRGRPGPPVVPRRVVSASHSPAPSEHETTPTPTRSALLSRPVPTPPVASTSSSSNAQLSPGLPSLPVRPAFNSAPPTIESEPPSGGVASLRSKFAGAGPGSSIERAPSPRPPPSPSKRDWQRPVSPVASTSGQHKPPPIPDRLTRPPRIAVSRPQPSESSAHEQPPSPSPPPLPSRSRPTSTHATGDSDSGHSLNGDLWSRSSSETSSSSSSSTCDDPQQCSNNNHDRGPPPPVPARPGTGSTGSLSVHPPPLPVRRQGSTSSGSPTSDTPPPMLPSRSPQLAPPPPLPSRPGGGAPNSPSPSLPPRPSTPNPPQNKIATVATTPTPKGPPSPLPPPRPSATMPPPARPHLAPPPTRIIAPGAPLPTRRTSPGGSSSDSEDDAELAPSPSTRTSHMPYRRKTLDDMPDASSASRRPPLLHSAALHVPAHTGVVAVAGHTVLIASSTIRIFDLSGEESAYSDATLPPHMAPAPVITLDVRDLGLEWRSKEHRVTAAEFRPALEGEEEEGRYVWLGTRDGHLLELDAWSGRVLDVRSAIHSGAVVHILLGEREMVTVDENGKALRWAGARGKGGAGVLRQSARLVRLPERTGFVGVHAGWMWAASAAGGGGTPAGSNSNLNLGSTLKKGFASATSVDNVSSGGQWTLRAYDLRSGGAAACAVLPTHDVGAVTCGATLPAQPGVVFLGHEGGVVSLWDTTTASPSPTSASSPDGGRSAPVCVQTLKIGAGDVLALAGVGARLWAGGRSGYIAAYDVGARPWRATNVWKAHGELPVLRLGVDVVGIAKTGRVGVWSVGRDECVRFWDGLLGGEWVEDQLLQRERHFCTYRALRTLICTWNVDAARPDGLTGSPANVTFLENLLQSVETPDVIVFGFQELIDLESRKLTAKNVLLGGNKKKADGSISSKVSRSYKLWHDALVLAVRVAMPATCPYTVVHTENLVGLFTCIFVKSTEVASLRDVAVSTVKRGLGGRYGNKGAIAARFVIDDSSVCFVNCHLAAGQKHVKTRNADVAAILEDRAAFSPSEGLVNRWDVSYVGGGDGSMILDHEICFLNGDLNYRIDQRREAVMSYVRGGDYDFLLQHDQLLKELAGNPYFRLRVFREAARIAFAPTYKYDRRSDAYDTSEKRRAPAWCDRVLVRAREPERVRCLEGSYRRWEVDVSDHRPVSAAFEMTVKKVDWARRERERKEVLRDWDRVAGAMLREAREWYAQQGAIWLA